MEELTIRHFEDAVNKVRRQREMRPEEKMNISHFR